MVSIYPGGYKLIELLTTAFVFSKY